MIESPRGMSIMEAYELFRNDKLWVNRRYQRKLVWSTKEKQKLVESVLLQFPIPLVLLASKEDEFEIIDGMQRFNAIFSFIENKFPILWEGKDKYFSVKDYTFAQAQNLKGVFKAKKGVKFLKQEEVSKFISYQFPITIIKAGSSHEINETFRRINSTGRHLSPQEVRQAGNLSKFSLIVRDIASELRGDASSERLLLQDMPTISIDSKLSALEYGINAEDTFWCKHGILRVNDLRESEDEQFIADIILSTSLGEPFPASKKAFDSFYGSGEVDKSNDIDVKLNSLSIENVRKEIILVFSEIISFVDAELKNERLKNILNPNARGNPVKEGFYTLFMAFYELMIYENKLPFDYAAIKASLQDIHSKLVKSRNYTTTADRRNNINVCKGLIQDYFKDNESTFRSPTTYIIDFQTYLTKSKVETAVYDFKQGLYTLHPSNREFSEKTFSEKILKSISALANLGKNKVGYLFIGVTDKEEDTLRIETLDNLTDVPRFHQFGVVGLEREATLRGVTLDEYISFITNKISTSDLPKDLKVRVTKDLTPITYHGNTVLMIIVESGDEPVYFKDKLYQRDGANTVEVKGSNQANIFKLFK